MERPRGTYSVCLALILFGMFFQGYAQTKDVFVRGFVFDQMDAPIENAMLFFGYPDSTFTKSDGSFSFLLKNKVAPIIKFYVQKEGHTTYTGLVNVTADTMDLGKIILQKAGKTRDIRITGQVVDSMTNMPVKNALITIYTNTPYNLPKDSCYSDSTGSFNGTLTVEETNKAPQFYYNCTKAGYLYAGGTKTANATDFFEIGTIVLHKEYFITVPITGTIVDSLTSGPVENARIIMMIYGYAKAYQDTMVSGLDGGFSDSIMVSNAYIPHGCKMQCVVFKDGYRDVWRSGAYPAVTGIIMGQIKMLKLEKLDSVSVTGTVRDSVTLAPIENATVTIGYTVKFGGNDSLLVLRHTLVSGSQGAIAKTIQMDVASHKNTAIICIVKMNGYATKYCTKTLDQASLNLGDILLRPVSISVDKNPVHRPPELREPDNVRFYSLDGRLLFEENPKNALSVAKLRQRVSARTFIAVFRHRTKVLYAKKMVLLPE